MKTIAFYLIKTVCVIASYSLALANFPKSAENSISADKIKPEVLLYFNYIKGKGFALNLLNTGETSFTVDEDMVVGIEILFFSANWDSLSPSEGKYVTDDFPTRRKRLRKLDPGEMITRNIFVDKPIKVFSGDAMGYARDNSPIFSAAEYIKKIPEETRFLKIRYSLLYPAFDNARFFWGFDKMALDLYSNCTPSLIIDLNEIYSYDNNDCF